MALRGWMHSEMPDEHSQYRDFMRELSRRTRRARLKKKKKKAASRIDELEREVDELKLYVAALVRYSMSKGQLDAEEFKEFVAVIDESDGELDGKYDGEIA